MGISGIFQDKMIDPESKREISGEIKTINYRALRKIILSISCLVRFFIYYTGLLNVIIFIRRHIFKKYRSIIIVYHSISNSNPHYSGKRDYMISQSVFENQIRYLKKRFKIISLEEMLSNLNNHKNITSDCIAITFDDGYGDNLLEAVPVLKKYSVSATFFLISGFIGKKNYLNRDQLINMQNQGFGFGSHTLSHPYLTKLNENETRKEIALSKYELEGLLGTKIRYFSYPYGHFNKQITRIVKEVGYEAAFSMIDGTCNFNTDLFLLKRKGILNRPFYFFAVKIEGVFENWPFSRIRKKLWYQ